MAGHLLLFRASGTKNICRILSLFIAAAFFLMAAPAGAADTLPDLRAYQPPGWSGPLVLSTVKGTSTDADSFVAACYYLDWAIANYSSTVNISQAFLVRLVVDGVTVREWTLSGLDGWTYTDLTDFPVYLAAGTHTLKLVIDPGGAVIEQNESNNEYTKTVTVLASGNQGSLSGRPVSHDFGRVSSGRTATRVLTFSNGGPGDLPVGTVSLAGDDAGAFTINADACSGKTLPPPDCSGACAASCTVTVAFSPRKIAPVGATLSVADAAQAVLSQVSLTGAAEPGVGDFNGDGKISLEDGILLLQVLTGGAGSPPIPIQAGIDPGARVGLADVIYVMQRVAGQRGSDLYDLVKIRTGFGTMLIWLYEETPLHRDNFLALAREGFYNGLIFHRVIRNFVIQGGDPLGTGAGGPGYTVCPEFNAALTHGFGAVASARLADSANPGKSSSGSQFYIAQNAAGTHDLDMNYTVFGKVIDGLAVINAIAAQPTDAANDRPLTPIAMEKVEVVTYSARQLLTNFGFIVGSH